MGELYRYRERGVTSLIVVLFSTLLFVVVSVGFMQLMTAEQRASVDNELSRGAYDSALSGVEDGKRVLKACMNGGADSAEACAKIALGDCDTVSAAGLVTAKDGEVYLQSSSSNGVGGLAGKDYEQAYTCVKVARDTKDYVKNVTDDSSVLIPLRTVAPVDTVDISWFARSNSTSDTVELDPVGDLTAKLIAKSGWETNRPPVLRVQLMQYKGDDIDLSSLDGDNGHTVYLYPKSAGSSALAFSLDARRSGAALTPTLVKCAPTFVSAYACTASITLPTRVGGPASNAMAAFLRITPIYNNAEISVMPKDSTTGAVKFHDLQPSIDSTGRAADVFRRVEARVETGDPIYPRATVDITNNLCKVFSVTDSVDTYDAGICN